MRDAAAAWTALACALLLTACGMTIPTDPDGTLDEATGGVLRVGISVDPGVAEVSGSEPTGPLVDLTADFAESISADPRWTVGSEETLVTMLEEGQVDMVIGGMTSDTPWTERAGVSRGYRGIDQAEDRALVVLVPLGENALLAAVEGFLDREVGR